MKFIIRSLVVLAVVPLLLEGALRLFDPWGIRGYFPLLTIYRHIVPDHHRDYRLTPGDYDLGAWRVSERPDGTRNIPDNRHGACRVVFLGDSVTWGQGVSDADTWVNLIAAQLPDIDAVNPAFLGYNSEQVRALWSDYPSADVGIYLVIDNDADRSASLVGQSEWLQDIQTRYSFLQDYVTFLQGSSTPKDPARFARDLDALTSDPRIVLVSFDNPFGKQVAQRWPVHLIPSYQSAISFTDRHPSAAGNREIAAAMLPLIRQVVREHCTAVF